MRTVFYDVNSFDEQLIKQALGDKASKVELVAGELNPRSARANAEVVSVFVNSQIDKKVLEAMPRLKHIALRATGFDSIDLVACGLAGVSVSNVPTYGERTVAEYTFGLLLSLSRKLNKVFEATARGIAGHESLIGWDLAGKTIGIIGAGHIGSCVAEIASGFGMKVLVYDVMPKPELVEKYGVDFVELKELLANSDVVSLHMPYTKANHHFMSQGRFAQMKPGAYLINTARGELVYTAALVQALTSGHLGGAALDVLESEELLDVHEELLLLRNPKEKQALLHSIEHDILFKLDNVIISNHNAYNTADARRRIIETTVDNINSFVRGRPQNLVNEQ